jgi:16S rRNA (adenine1518-N6/adenine1519-N6)-dimethyltransferase
MKRIPLHILDLIGMRHIQAKKSLGQHFLTDKNIAQKIVQSLKADPDKTVLEIGPGTGALTDFLLPGRKNFFAIEIDDESIEYLKKEYSGFDFVLKGNILKTDFNKFTPPISVIGNFPYYISSQIFFHILEYRNSIDEVVCMIQKEVAERIASPPGNKTYGILSVLLQTFYNLEYLFTVHENCFNPPPKVKSAVIRLTRNQRKELPFELKLYKMVIKQSFNQRRKTLRNSLKNICLNLDKNLDVFNKRPEQLSIEEFIELTQYIENCKKKLH